MALDFGKLNFSTSFNPTSAFPLDARCYFESLTAAQAAALTAEEAGSTNTVYYFGQQIAVLETGKATLYIIQPKASGTGGELAEVGSQVLGDNKTIVLKDGILSLNEFGEYYYEYVENPGAGESHYRKVAGFKAGLQPQVSQVLVEGVNVYKLEWYEPNPTTVEGLETRLTAVEAATEALQGVVGDDNSGLVKDVNELKEKVVDPDTEMIILYGGSASAVIPE